MLRQMGSKPFRYDHLYNLMQDSIFEAAAEVIEGVDHPATDNFLHTARGDLVITDSLWNRESVTHGLLPEQYHIPPAIGEMYNQAMRIPQLSSSSLQLHHQLFDNLLPAQNTFKVNSAFRKYKNRSCNGFQLLQESSMKQKAVKRCVNFLRKMHKDNGAKPSWEVDDRLLEESYASTHRIAERNRRIKLSQQFLALRSLLAHNYKKADKQSILSNAIMELNRQKHRITELEQRNKALMNAVNQKECEGYSSLSHGYSEDSGKRALKRCIYEEIVVVIEESNIADEAIMQITLKSIASNSTHMDAIIALINCLREMKLGVVRIQCRELDSINPVIEVTIQRQKRAQGWEIQERKELEEVVKQALNAA